MFLSKYQTQMALGDGQPIIERQDADDIDANVTTRLAQGCLVSGAAHAIEDDATDGDIGAMRSESADDSSCRCGLGADVDDQDNRPAQQCSNIRG